MGFINFNYLYIYLLLWGGGGGGTTPYFLFIILFLCNGICSIKYNIYGNACGKDFDLPFLLLIYGHSFLILMTFQFHLHIQDHNGYNEFHR